MIRVRTILLVAVIAASACGDATRTEGVTSGEGVPPGIETCAPTDQVLYVYRPARLHALAPCIRVIGTVMGSSIEADGDIHINVRLDAPYRGVLRPGNDFEDGELIVEPVCQFAPPQADAIRICAADATPLGSVPRTGDHVQLEGRYVLDLQHHSWAELHPLYRWELAAP